jgi:hypothetical protein
MAEDNSERMKAVQERKRSNAAGIHNDKREKKARTREAKLRKALREEES